MRLLRPSLVRTSFLEGFRISRIFKGLYDPSKPVRDDLDNIPRKLVIARLIQEYKRNPNDWLVLYLLGDWYNRAKRYQDSINILKKAYRIRPKDPRSTFALATAYRVLTRARYEDMDREEIFSSSDDEEISRTIDFDPIASAKALDELNITVDEAAEKAMEYFDMTLTIGVRKKEKKYVVESLEKMFTDFPHLEMKVKNKRGVQNGLFNEAKKGSDGILNDAIGHYSRLRFLTHDLPRYRFELGEVIRLCQWSIAADHKNGDAYILLANAYSELDSNVQFGASDHFQYMRWAAAIIQHWSDTPLRNFPFTKNKKIGEKLYEEILDSVIKNGGYSKDQGQHQMKTWSKSYVDDALNPRSYSDIKEKLNNQPLI